MPNKNKNVIDRILARKNGVKDNYKIGLIFEGGGMRGQFSSGAASALHVLGLTDCFDFVYGSSSGSCAATYLLSGNIEEASHIYYNYLSGFRFIKPWRVSKLIDIDYLCDDVFSNKVPFNLRNIDKAKPLLRVYVSDPANAKSICFTNRDKVDYYALVKASCAVPGYYNKRVKVGDIEAVDGNSGAKMPITEAYNDGCTDVLAISTSEESERESMNHWFWLFLKFLLRNWNKSFIENYHKEINSYNSELDVIFGKNNSKVPCNIFTISPDYRLSPAEVRSNKLKKIERMGYNKIMEAFKGVK